MIIREIKVESAFKYLWLKTVKDVDLSQHCARCLIGEYDNRINSNTKEEQDIELNNGYIYYLCGVAYPYKWENNFHLAFRYKKGGMIDYYSNGIHVVIEDAEALPIDEKYNNPLDKHIKIKAFYTCRNWQFANYFETHLKDGGIQ
jgi:hypothetical protein